MSLVKPGQKVYAVRHEGGKDDADCWTISTDPNNTGWETDSGYDGYGLSKEDAEHHVRCINEHEALVAEVNRLHFVLFEVTKKSIKWTPETKSAKGAGAMKLHWSYSGADQGFHIYMGDEHVHFTKDEYTRDMFIAELKARITMIQEDLRNKEEQRK